MTADREKMGYWSVVAIGVGGMVGGGIFAVLGLSVQLTRGAAPIAFLIAGLVALVTSYSYTRLSVTFPNEGGTVAFLDNAFGPGLFSGTMNVLLWISYIVMLFLIQKNMRLLSMKSLTPRSAVLKIFHKPGTLMTIIRIMKPAPVRPSIS